MLPSPAHGPLVDLVMVADAALSSMATDGAILRVSALAPATESFNWHPLDGAHPLEVLMGFRAPPHWQALGVSCAGRAHRLDDDGRRRSGDATGDEVTVTVLVDRAGAAAGVMRRGGEVTPLPGRPEGTVADACRRALALPTAPPPPSTLGLWTASWLDRLVELASGVDAARLLSSWPAVARLHAAAGLAPGTAAVGGPAATGDPGALAAAAQAFAETWPWARLRDDPAVLDVPGPPPPPELAAWMDDGMWARWLLSHLPAADDLMAAVHALLPPRLADGVDRVVASWGGR